VIRTLRTALVAGAAGLLLLTACEAGTETDATGADDTATTDEVTGEGDGQPDVELGALELYDWETGGDVVARLEDGEWDGALPEVPEDDTLRLGLRLFDADGAQLDLTGDDDAVQVRFDDDADEGIVTITEHGDHLDLFGEVEGLTRVVFHWLRDDDVVLETPPLRVIVDHFAGDFVAGREILEPEPRLLVADGDDPLAHVYDLISEELLATFDLQAADPLVTTSRFSGQIAALAQPSAGVVHLVDAGTWAVGHGDHGHYYIDEPRLLDVLDLDTPGRAMHGPDRIGLLAAGDGAAMVVTELDTLRSGEARASVLETPGSGDGAVVPLRRGYVAASWSEGADASAAPDEVAILDGDDVVETHACADLRASTPTAAGAAFLCDEQVLLVLVADDDVRIETVPLPSGTGPLEHVSGSVHHDVIAASADAELVLVDALAGQLIETVALPAEALSEPHIDDDGRLLVVTDDGVVHQFDLETGALVASSDERVDVSLGDEVRPHIVGGRDRAYVSSPADGRVLEFATNDDLRLARTFEVGGTPAGLAYFGAQW
jgi:hypothetical protein